MICKICGQNIRGGPDALSNAQIMRKHLSKEHPGWKKQAMNGNKGQKCVEPDRVHGQNYCRFCGHKL